MQEQHPSPDAPFNALRRASQESANADNSNPSPIQKHKLPKHIYDKALSIKKHIKIHVEYLRSTNTKLYAKLQKRFETLRPLDPSEHIEDEDALEKRKEAFEALIRMSLIGIASSYDLAHPLLSAYHSSGKEVRRFMADNVNRLIQDALGEYDAILANGLHLALCGYLNAFESLIAHGLPKTGDDIRIGKYDDDMGIVLRYIDEINNALNGLVLGKHAPYPLQFDTFFVSLRTTSNLDLHNLNVTEFGYESVNELHGIKPDHSIYRFIRDAKSAIRDAKNGQRFVLLIVRREEDNISKDSWYLMRQTDDDLPFSDYGDLTFHLNSKRDIVPGLPSSAEGVLGVCYYCRHLRNSVFLSYGHHKGLVTKSTMVQKLQTVCEQPVNGRLRDYKDLEDNRSNHGAYWFGDSGRGMETKWTLWNPNGSHAMANIWISKKCTKDLYTTRNFLDERKKYKNAQAVFYHFNYSLCLQIADGQVLFRMHNGEGLCLIPTGWHKRGKLLYAVAVPNLYYYHENKTGQRWKIIDYKHISGAFMTDAEVSKRFGIDTAELPKGSAVKNKNWSKQKATIHILGDREGTIKVFTAAVKAQKKPQIVQSGRQKKKIEENCADCVIAKISSDELIKAFAKSLIAMKDDAILPCIAHINTERQKYHIEKLVVVRLEKYNAYVAVQIMLAEDGTLKIGRIGLDYFDICNKAELIGDAQNSMLSKLQNSVDALHICDQRSSNAPIQEKSSKVGAVQPQAIERSPILQQEEQSNNLPIAMGATMPPNFTNIQNPSPIVLAPNPILQQAMNATIMHRMVMGKTKTERTTIIANILYPCVAHWFPNSRGIAGKVTVMLLGLRDIDPLVLTYDSAAFTIKMNEVVDILIKNMK